MMNLDWEWSSPSCRILRSGHKNTGFSSSSRSAQRAWWQSRPLCLCWATDPNWSSRSCRETNDANLSNTNTFGPCRSWKQLRIQKEPIYWCYNWGNFDWPGHTGMGFGKLDEEGKKESIVVSMSVEVHMKLYVDFWKRHYLFFDWELLQCA
jgi:hypothetical protein